jgi:hypothetical protein
MAFKFDFDLENKIIRSRSHGVVTDESLKLYYAAASEHSRLNPDYSGICDISDVEFFAVSTGTIRELAKLPPAIRNPDIPRCVVAGSTALFGMARMFELEGEETRPNLHVVRTEKEAFAILRVANPRFGSTESE